MQTFITSHHTLQPLHPPPRTSTRYLLSPSDIALDLRLPPITYLITGASPLHATCQKRTPKPRPLSARSVPQLLLKQHLCMQKYVREKMYVVP